jgi:hypothetical protein
MHAVSDGNELALLTRAADLWKSGVALYNNLASVNPTGKGTRESRGLCYKSAR